MSVFAPGSMLSLGQATGRLTSIEAEVPIVGGNQCTAVACNRGAPATSGAVSMVAVLGILVVAAVAVALRRAWRRTTALRFAMPVGSPFSLLRPPQQMQPA